MLRILMLAGLLATSGSALAHDDDDDGYRHDRGISTGPSFIISFGNRHHDHHHSLYESDVPRYWFHSHYRPEPVIVLPPRHIRHIHPHHGGWDDRRDWRHDRHHRHNHRRDHRRHGL